MTLAQLNARRIQGRKLPHLGGTARTRLHFATIPSNGDPLIRQLLTILRDEHAGNILNLCHKAGVYGGILNHMRNGRNVSLQSFVAILNATGHTLKISRIQEDCND